jgi:mannitol/fructose-specific phosphotransferase system IIA component (Ntr-type)
MTNSEQAIREFAEGIMKSHETWGKPWNAEMREEGIEEIMEITTALISEHYVSREEYNELLQQRDELKEALISLMWQFAYYGTKNNVAVMHTGGLSALEDAFSALGLSDPITVENFEAAIKNTKDETDTIQR